MSKSISKIHYLTQDMEEFSHESLAKMACNGAMDWVQLRVKEQSYDDWLDTAWEVKKICNEFNAKLIINDNIEIAREVGADGVHLGKNDFPPMMARPILGPDIIIGATANTIEEIRYLHKVGVDYIGVGPFRFTKTKKILSPVLGLEGYQEIMAICKREFLTLPIIAIGGILLQDCKALLAAGVHGVAVSSAINKSVNPTVNAMKFHKIIKSLENVQSLTQNQTIDEGIDDN